MATIQRFEEIEAWQLARKMTVKIYVMTKRTPFSQDYDLKSQIQAALGSAMHNIAEGFDAGSDAEFMRFLRYARRSTSEVQSELYLTLDQNYVTDHEFHEIYTLAKQCKHKINALISYLKRNKTTKRPPDQSTTRLRDQTTKRPNDQRHHLLHYCL